MLVLWSFELLPIHSWVDKLNRESGIAYALTTARDKTIDIFNWEDPVQKGENFIRDILNPNSTEA